MKGNKTAFWRAQQCEKWKGNLAEWMDFEYFSIVGMHESVKYPAGVSVIK